MFATVARVLQTFRRSVRVLRSYIRVIPKGEQMPEALMTPDEVVAYLSVPRATLYAWRHNGGGPRSIKVGRHLRYRLADLDAWLDAQADKPAA